MIQVLIVEDVEEMREMLRTLVEGIQGFRTSGVAGNGWEARVELDRRKPDIVLLDEILPGESSLDLLEEFKLQGVPVLLMTGVEDPTHSLPAGTAGRLQKPDWKDLAKAGARFEAAIRSALK